MVAIAPVDAVVVVVVVVLVIVVVVVIVVINYPEKVPFYTFHLNGPTVRFDPDSKLLPHCVLKQTVPSDCADGMLPTWIDLQKFIFIAQHGIWFILNTLIFLKY